MSTKNSNSRVKQDNRGMTMVELIISFMLLSLFVVVATMIISATMNIYYQVRGVSYGLQVSEIIQSKIAGGLEGAINGDITSDALTDASGQNANGAMLIAETEIEFLDKTGSHVKIGLGGQEGAQYLVVHYYAVPSRDGNGNLYDAVDWSFDKAVYMGYTIQKLQFTRPKGDYADNVIQVELTITSPKYGAYTTTEYVECYNFADAADWNRIVDARSQE
jgi:hypothetical protein